VTGAACATVLLLVAGVAFHAVASAGMLRLPDFYCRLHALSKADTLGTLLILVAVAVWEGLSLTTVKVLLIAVFFFLSNPVAAHAVARAAFRTGVRP
jgi:multicomponent Na+:H+ antiporter subunit G